MCCLKVNYNRVVCCLYSGGNKRKLSTAIALVGNPPIVLLVSPMLYVLYSRKVGGELILADWWIWSATTKLNAAKLNRAHDKN